MHQHVEQLLWMTIAKDGGSHGGKQSTCYCIKVSSVSASQVHHVPWQWETQTSSNTSPFLEMTISSTKTKLRTSSTRRKRALYYMRMCTLNAMYYARLLSELSPSIDIRVHAI